MMKLFRILMIILFGGLLAVFLDCMVACAQDPNPQTSFANTENYANPSLVLNFNDATTSFKDQISGLSFVNTGTQVASTVPGTTVTPTRDDSGSAGDLFWNNIALTTGYLTSVSVKWHTAPSPGQSITFLIGSAPSSGNITVQASFSVTLAATTALQTFTAPADFTAVPVTAGEVLGEWAAAGLQGSIPGGGSGLYYGSAQPFASVPTGTIANGYAGAPQESYSGTVTTYTTITSGTVTPRQPGFDSTLANNTSAEFPWNGWSAAPNNTLGAAMEWNTPWSMMVQVDRLNWNRTGRLVLASKGDLASGNRWQLYLQMAANNLGDANVQLSQLCFERYSSAIFLPLLSGGTENGICTSASDQDVMPNGFNYNIIVTDSGTGASGMYGTSALDIYINGLDKTTGITEVPFTGSYNAGFGDVGITYSSGTGYANSTVFTSSGGGANCNVAGHLFASGGVPNNLLTDISNYGCTSVPTITLTSPTGTGVTLTPSLIGSSMNSTTSPLMVPGYVSGGTTYGVAGTTSTQTPTYIDEFAIFPFVLNLTQINDLFYWTKFYQIVANTQSANRPVVLLADDGCSDIGNATMTQFVIVLHSLGIIKLEGVVSAGLSSLDVYDSSASFWRQMLDQAGLSNVPVGNLYSGTDANKNWCQTANLNTYNASTPQASTGFPTSASVVRTVMANNPTTPVIIYNGPAPANNWLYDFMQSPADSISSLTGQQLWDQDVANGGAMWWQGAPSCYPSAYPSPTPCSGSWTTLDASASQYVFSHLDGMPTYQVGGTPQGYGQGFAYTRTAKDPMYLACAAAGGSCSRAGWGQYALASLFTSYFTNGVAVGYSGGGTGYANVTPFTSTGGGANCVVNGIMTASGGVPNGIETSWGAAQPLISTDSMVIGMGSGCTSAPTLVLTSPTGTGVTLTAYPLTVCGTGSVSGSTYSFTSATCANQYFVPFTQWANVGMPLIYNWFLNSLSDPPTNGRPMGAP